jgi:DNA-binding FadR family transcriptional regulator
MKQLKPLDTTYRYRAVQDALRNFIIENHLQPGDRLPSEMELAAQLGVSRNPIREAIKGLEALGLVEVRVGLGAFVKAASMDDILTNFAYNLLFDGRSVAELYEIRQRLELSYAREAVEGISDAALAEMEGLVGEMEQLQRAGKDYHLSDVALHKKLFEPVGNATLLKLFDIFDTLYTNTRHLFESEPATSKEEDIRKHKELMDALRQRDADLVVERLKNTYTPLPHLTVTADSTPERANGKGGK